MDSSSQRLRTHGGQGTSACHSGGVAAVLCVCILLLTGGCGQSGPKMAPVTGRVTLDANPVEGAVVRLAPVGGGTCAVGITDAEGRYELKTINRKGALLGDHQVSVSKDELVIDRTVLVSRAAQRKGLLAYKLEHNLPSQYASSSTSGLTVVVESGYNEFDFELHSQ